MDKDSELLHEINQRVTRMESRMVQLGDFVGANLRAKQKIDVRSDHQGAVRVVIDALDVSLSRVASVMRDAGYRDGQYEIVFNHAVIGTIDMHAIHSIREA